MGFFDKVRDVLTSADSERQRRAREARESREASQAADSDTATAGPEPEERDTGAQRSHTVVRGDTLSAIAERYGVDVHELAALNQLDNPDLIYPGQVFRVPPA